MWSWGWWWPGSLVAFAFMMFCMVMMARMMMGHGMSSSHGHESREGPDVPERILAKRLASGEIDVDEYERLRAALHETRDATGK